MKGVEKEGAETAGPSSRHCLPTCRVPGTAGHWQRLGEGCTREALKEGQDLSGGILRSRRDELILEESEQEKAPSEG